MQEISYQQQKEYKKKESVSAAEMRRLFEQANENRDYTIYDCSMDAALEAKAKSIFPYLGKVGEGSVIVDAGSGTRKLAELAATEFRGARVYALDISHEFLERTEEEKSLIHPVFGNAMEQNFPENLVDAKYYSTVGHEIESFEEDGMRLAVRNTLKELKPGGRLVIRDFAKPSQKEPVYMRILSKVGIDKVPDGTKDENIDYNLLSTQALFDRFHQEFKGGNSFSYERVVLEGNEYIKIDSVELAHEFYLRKDYTANWPQEIEEKYTYWTFEEAKCILEKEGYVNVRVIPDPNEYILENRLKGKIALFQMSEGKLKEMPFPATHMVIVAEKPSAAISKEDKGIKKEMPKVIDYKERFSTIKIDHENKKVHIDKKEFTYEAEPKVGTKKLIFKLSGEPSRILKVVRSDTHNDHNVFKSMYQMIERQNILRKLAIPHLKILEYDSEGPPYRYVVQEAAPEESVSAAVLIQEGKLIEEDIKQMARIVNACEKGKKWQLDTNPYSWFRVKKNDGSTQWLYASSKVYYYDEQWEFKKIGLLQWINPSYIENGQNYSAVIPKAKEYKNLQKQWLKGGNFIDYWKKYLDITLQPEEDIE